ncbi:MAG: prepilin-type N-terminal cleavage/methylation domain-containing protein [Planctomycetota bacterium]|nr:prepilin-type N-terminal cleavage/methylation domain-containing protein [Planctomycetota bacterium]
MRFRSARARGMTLMEVMIATAILVFGLVAIFGALQAGLNTHKRARDETNAAFVGASVMAELRTIFSQGAEPTPIPETAPRQSSDYPDYYYAVTFKDITPSRGVRGGPALGREFFVEVKVTWREKSDDRKWIAFNTVMFKRSER